MKSGLKLVWWLGRKVVWLSVTQGMFKDCQILLLALLASLTHRKRIEFKGGEGTIKVGVLKFMLFLRIDIYLSLKRWEITLNWN